MTSVSFGKGIASISEATFYDCDALTSITIPGNITSIGKGAFEDCDALTSATIEKGTIGAWAFRNCRTLTSITLGEDVFKIDEKSFVNTSINTCYCYSTIPPSIGSYAFYNAVKDDAKLYVPARCVSIYKQFWGEYFKIIIEMD